jgi:hypothetical protein
LFLLVTLLWVMISLISLNHIHPFLDQLVLPVPTLGIIGWLFVSLSLLFLVSCCLRQTIFLFTIFCCVGYSFGPYLEPPADPLYHLEKTFQYCEYQSDQIPRINRGFWHYSMSGSMLCSLKSRDGAKAYLRRIDLLHGIYWGIAAVVLFLLGRNAGLPDNWSFVSVLIAFLYFGTNRFSYFSYYSLAPSFSCMLIFWLWTALFFFKTKWKDIVIGLIMAALGLPILLVNHQQEAVFLGLVSFVFLFIKLNQFNWKFVSRVSSQKLKFSSRLFYLVSLLLIIFILPQLSFFQRVLSNWFPSNNWLANQRFLIFWNDWHLIGKIWGSRIDDTLGLFGFAPLFIIILTFIPGPYKKLKKNRRMVILGVLPFLIYFLPLFHFVWVFNTRAQVYWRMCYASMFWLTFALFLYNFEELFINLLKKIKNVLPQIGKVNLGSLPVNNIYIKGCLIFILIFGGIRSGPFYGKLDFISLESRPWWHEWKPMIENMLHQEREFIISDPITSLVMSGVFNQRILSFRELSRLSVQNTKQMEYRNSSNTKYCVINIRGFQPSWVPLETGHWQRDLAYTRLYYKHDDMKFNQIEESLQENPPKDCLVFF